MFLLHTGTVKYQFSWEMYCLIHNIHLWSHSSFSVYLGWSQGKLTCRLHVVSEPPLIDIPDTLKKELWLCKCTPRHTTVLLAETWFFYCHLNNYTNPYLHIFSLSVVYQMLMTFLTSIHGTTWTEFLPLWKGNFFKNYKNNYKRSALLRL